MMHFAEADSERGIEWQLERFHRMTEGWDLPVSPSKRRFCVRLASADCARLGTAGHHALRRQPVCRKSVPKALLCNP